MNKRLKGQEKVLELFDSKPKIIPKKDCVSVEGKIGKSKVNITYRGSKNVDISIMIEKKKVTNFISIPRSKVYLLPFLVLACEAAIN